MGEFRLETARLVLREWRDSDREAYWQGFCDAEAMRYLLEVDREESDAKIDRAMAMQAEHGHCCWAMERRADGGLIGTCGVLPPREPFFEYELGWRLDRHWWGQGLATEAAAASLAWAWANLATPTAIAITVPANVASWKLMERIGMAHQPAENFDHPDLDEGDPLLKHIIYRIRRPTADTNVFINDGPR